MSSHRDEPLLEGWAEDRDAEPSLRHSGSQKSSRNVHPCMKSRNLSQNTMRSPNPAGDHRTKSFGVESSKNPSCSTEPGGNVRTPSPPHESNSRSYQGSQVNSSQNRRSESQALPAAGRLKRDYLTARPAVATGEKIDSSGAAAGGARAIAWVLRLFEPHSSSNETASHYLRHRRHLQGDQRHHLSHQLGMHKLFDPHAFRRGNPHRDPLVTD